MNQGPRRRTTIAAAATYGLVALAAYWPLWPGDPHRILGCACGDQVEEVWFLAWTPLALLHGHDPFVTNYLLYPRGANLANNTLMPALGLIGAPLTLAAGAVSTYNLWLWLAYPLSATAAFVLLRRWTGWTPAAFLGGLLYGFSPYMVAQGSGHLFLIFAPLPPLIFLLLDELVVRRHHRPVLVGLVLGLVLAAQYLVSSEVFGGCLVLGTIGIALVVVSERRRLVGRARHALAGLFTAAVVAAALIGYPVAVQLTGPDRFVGSAHGAYPFAADLLGLIVPTTHQLLAPASLVAVSNRFILGDITENGSYLGIPLLILLVAIVIRLWKEPIVRFAGSMAVAAEAVALGPRLTVDGHTARLPLPDALLDHLPLFSSFAYARFALYVDLFAALLLAVGIDRWHRRWTPGQPAGLLAGQPAQPVTRQPAHRQLKEGRGGRWARWRWGTWLLAGTAVVALVPIIPDWPDPVVPVRVPRFFSDAAEVDRIPVGSVALTYPYAADVSDQAMLWQAATSMRFRLMGGYALVPGPNRQASFDPDPPALVSVPATLIADEEGTVPQEVTPGTHRAGPGELRRFLAHYRVETVLARPIGVHPRAALDLLEGALGPPVRVGGMEVWFDVPSLLHRDAEPPGR